MTILISGVVVVAVLFTLYACLVVAARADEKDGRTNE